MPPRFYVAMAAFICAAAVYGWRPTSDAAAIALLLAIAGCTVAS